ncbi:hypothetical protein KC19_12G118400 [Ceratodon purpureus]|uniref:HTH myb-type domain-containing protein n=1 Tax=Ceratodon purpureus TaxID=3225 RepID=A0A8T0G782_CERPU|nr:hypothetical protein KC19_12G118400 [Ceratodon purpureus]
MQGEGHRWVENAECWEEGSPARSADCTLPGSSSVINSPIHTSAASKSAPPSLGGARCSDGKTRRYVRSSEPRLKWNAELHQCFERAIEQLGGPEKATPKAILQEMNIRGLRIAHVKSHLQMFRNPKKRNSSSPHSDFTFWSGKQSADAGAPPDPVQEDSGSVWNLSLDHAYESEAVGPELWRSMGKGPADIHSTNALNFVENLSGKEQPHSGEFSGCTFDSSPQFNRMNAQISNIPFSAGDQSRAVDLRPEVFKESYPSIFKMVEVLENRASKSRDLETLDEVDIDRRQLLSNQLLAGDADATRLYDSAELLAHNLLMAMRERRLLEMDSTKDEQYCVLQLGQQSHGTTPPELPLELTMSVGVPDSDSNIRPEILTLDLTGQMNRSNL